MRSKRYRLVLMVVKIIDILINPEYNIDENLHCKNCCKVCNRKGNSKTIEKDIDTVTVKW